MRACLIISAGGPDDEDDDEDDAPSGSEGGSVLDSTVEGAKVCSTGLKPSPHTPHMTCPGTQILDAVRRPLV